MKDKISGETVQKYKYIFLSDRNVPYVGWSDYEMMTDRVMDSTSYDPARARDYTVNPDVFNGKLSYKVVLDDPMA